MKLFFALFTEFVEQLNDTSKLESLEQEYNPN